MKKAVKLFFMMFVVISLIFVCDKNISAATLSDFQEKPAWINVNFDVNTKIMAHNGQLTNLEPIYIQAITEKYMIGEPESPFSIAGFTITVVRDDGETVSFDTTTSAKNPCAYFERLFYMTDPVVTHPDWGDETWEAIKSQTVYVGMDEEMAEMSWGKPKRINTTTYSWGTFEQWCYYSSYLYFENGILNSWQD